MKTSNLSFGAKILCTLFLGTSVLGTSSQFNIGEKINQKAKDRIDQRIDQGIDKGMDKIEEDAKNSTKKKNSKQEKSSENGSAESGNPAGSNASGGQEPKFASYSKFDFVPGEKVIFFDDFSQDNVGDFPVKWNTNGTGEVVTSNSYEGKWLKMKSGTTYIPELASKNLPENYTIEYDLVFNGEGRNGSFNLELTGLENRNAVPDASDPTNMPGMNLTSEINPDGRIRYLVRNMVSVNGIPEDGGANTDISDNSLVGRPDEKFHISITVNGSRFRYYVNDKKVLDLPKVLPKTAYNAIIFRMWGWDEDIRFDALLGNFRYAEGVTDVRSKLLTEGKLVTRGILFDVNSEKIKPESYGTIKEIADVLKANPTVKVRIVGHTDSDGNAASNLDLSKRRGASVKQVLSSEFGIDASRMESDGKGLTEPVAPNTTPEGKAQNRRVEFIKVG